MSSDISLSRSELRSHEQKMRLHTLLRKDSAVKILRVDRKAVPTQFTQKLSR